jgi:pimeloyl-ACP methyl ester carboxylesterase
VSKLLLGCTYACNVSTTRERLEAGALLTLLHLLSPGAIGKMIVLAAKPRAGGEVALTPEQARWLRAILAGNKGKAMRGAVRGMIAFDSRPWLKDIRAPTLVVGGTHDAGVPRHHFDMLVSGIPSASGRLVERAGHTLIWTHTRELAQIMSEQW